MFSYRHKSPTATKTESAAKPMGYTPYKRPDAEEALVSQSNTSQSGPQLGRLDVNLDTSLLLEGMDSDLRDKQLFRVYRDMYWHDPICGSCADLFATLPFSEFSLGGANDKVLDPYREVVEVLNLKTAMPRISVDHQVTGAFCGSILYNKDKRRIYDMMTHKYENIAVHSLPLYSQDPIMYLKLDNEMRATLNLKSKRIDMIKEQMGDSFFNKLMESELELDPIGTIYVPRKTFSYGEGVSYFKRVMPIWMIEKNLYRGTLIESGRRQRGILHLMLGEEGWEPSPEDFSAITDLFMDADADPIGAVVATRMGIMINEFRCLAGDTLIDTDRGLIPISKICSASDGHSQKVDLKAVGWDGKLAPVAEWHYRGKKKAVSFKTASGTKTRCTPDHKFLTFMNGELDLVPITDIYKRSGYVLRPNVKKSDVNNSPLNLKSETLVYSNSLPISVPEVMTEDLAYVLGFIVSEGYVDDSSVVVYSTEIELLEKYAESFNTAFGVYPTISLKSKATAKTKSYFTCGVNSRQLVSLLQQLGCITSLDTRKGQLPSHIQRVPKSILRSSRECQYAFIGAFINGDGSVVVKRNSANVRFYSSSITLLREIQTLLVSLNIHSSLSEQTEKRKNSKGICHRLILNFEDSTNLLEKVSPYLLDRKNPYMGDTRSYGKGIPASIFVSIIEDRFVESSSQGVTLRHDDGSFVIIRGFGSLFRHFRSANSYLSYSNFKQGKYAEVFKMIDQFSPKLAVNLLKVCEHEYIFDRVVSLRKLRKKIKVYDLTMEDKTKPIFSANGLLAKNSGGDFWKVTDIWDQTGNMKMRALGISEALLSGDASYATMEGSMTVFVESLRAYRDMMTRRVFYEKVFPLTSLLNGNSIRNGKIIKRELMEGNTQDILNRMQDGSKLFIPTVHWAKQLKPEQDQAYMEILNQLTTAGVPVPLRALAAAGGFNLDDLLQNRAEDMAIQRQILEYNKELTAMKGKYAAPEGGGEGGGMGSFSSASAVLGDKPRPRLTDRNFGDPDVYEIGRTGKKKHVFRQSEANKQLNAKIAKALREIQRSGRTALTQGTVTKPDPAMMKAMSL